MDRRSTPTGARKRRRRMTLLWSAAVAAIVITLLATQQVALLYLLATLSLATLLVIVAWADLGSARRPVNEPAPLDDAAAIADGVSTPSTTFGSTARRTVKRR